MSNWDVYEDVAGEWRWRLKAGNGETVADSGEGYVTKFNAERAMNGVKRLVTDLEEENERLRSELERRRRGEPR